MAPTARTEPTSEVHRRSGARAAQAGAGALPAQERPPVPEPSPRPVAESGRRHSEAEYNPRAPPIRRAAPPRKDCRLSLLHAIVLALVQGVTEFLPISSQAHLILVPYLLGWPDQGLAFDVATNTGTLLAVVVYFRRDLRELVAGLLGRGGSGPAGGGATAEGAAAGTVEGMPPWRLLAALVLGTLPVAVAGLLAHDWVETAARNPRILATSSIVFGLALLAADRLGRRRRDLAGLGLLDAFLIGLAQAVALVPGTSRSGITITAALLLGFGRPAAARFAFLLAIPVGVLAAGWDGLKILRGGVPAADLGAMAVALVVSALAAYLVIGWLLAWLQRQSFTPFVVYRVLLGVAILVFAR